MKDFCGAILENMRADDYWHPGFEVLEEVSLYLSFEVIMDYMTERNYSFEQFLQIRETEDRRSRVRHLQEEFQRKS